MRCRFLVAVIGFAIAPTSALAQRPGAAQVPVVQLPGAQLPRAQFPGAQIPGVESAFSVESDFFATSGVARFQIIQGRLCLDPPRHRKGSQNRQSETTYESVTVTADRGIPSIHYVIQSPHQHLTLSVEQAYAVRIESWFPKTSERSVLSQPKNGRISWQLTRGDVKDFHQGPTLLHIRHCNQSDFDLHYGRMIRRLLRGRSIAAISQAAEAAMLSSVSSDSTPDLETVLVCVDELKSSKRATRVAAHQKLQSWGTPVIPILANLDWTTFDAEQTLRLQALQNQLRRKVDDTPATLAKLLANDRSYWIRIANTLDSRQLQLANQRLERSGAQPILLTADPETRVASSTESRK